MNKINVTQTLKNLDGSELQDVQQTCPTCGQTTEARTWTLRLVLQTALMTIMRGENTDGAEKVTRYALAMRVHQSDEVELNVEERAKLKDLVGKIYGPLIVGQVWEMLEE